MSVHGAVIPPHLDRRIDCLSTSAALTDLDTECPDQSPNRSPRPLDVETPDARVLVVDLSFAALMDLTADDRNYSLRLLDLVAPHANVLSSWLNSSLSLQRGLVEGACHQNQCYRFAGYQVLHCDSVSSRINAQSTGGVDSLL